MIQTRIGSLVIFLGVCVLAIGTGSKALTVYHHVDDDGTIHLTNLPRGGPFKKVVLSSPEAGPAPSAEDIRQVVRAVALRHNVDPALAEAVAQVESAFNPRAVSSAGAMGVMQLMPATAERFRVEDPFDPKENIRGGVEYLAWLGREFGGEIPLVLAGYHAGEGRVRRAGGIPSIPATQQYVTRAMNVLDRLLTRDGRTQVIQRFVDDNGILHLSNTR